MKNRSLNRIFHPIGQGAFYSERHDNFNMVYDCGVEWKDRGSEKVDALVRNSFNEGESIDVLFISHYDYDHIGKIPILKQNFVIKNVILPLLHKDEKIIITEIYKHLGVSKELISIIENPELFFPDSRIIRVDIYDNEGEQIAGATPIEIDDDNRENITIKSGERIVKKDVWEYIPYNIFNKNRSSQFKSLLEENGFDPQKMKENFDYSEKTRKKISDIYKDVKGDINANSMIVYSGPIKSSPQKIYYFTNNKVNHLCYWCLHKERRVGISCLYTGDSNMNDYNINSILPSKWDLVNTIQIPHHGDLKSFDYNQLNKRRFVCPISFGTQNTYGHPSNQVVSDLSKNHSNIIFVTENPTSIFVETIEYIG